MLHYFFKWRYEKKARAGAFKLPKPGKDAGIQSANLSSYLSHTSGSSRHFRPYDKPRRRRRIMQFVTTLLLITFVIWVTYESLIALALIGK